MKNGDILRAIYFDDLGKMYGSVFNWFLLSYALVL